ncbi:MAG: class I SAM-dependent rRNA methyltransferase [Deltaproteobacteria bacterium]|nr:class I SAM-dependent rRNA methyltransferase [Deltaproteobacteria bacterium]MBZ0219178.1 class I SAM-dependent rRNA methyltransferase [Deltaproteobacteria bacterium]
MEIAAVNRITRILGGHLWVFSNELFTSPKNFTPGSLVELTDRKGNFLGIGYVNPQSLISIRILTRKREEIDLQFFKRRIEAALDYRKRVIGEKSSFRAVYSESDFLPGLIVDKYGDCLSLQFLTLGMEAISGMVIEALEEVYKPSSIVLRNDSSIRSLEGLPLEKKVLKGSIDPLPRLEEDGAVLEVDPMSGQKTGFFLDQAENRRSFASFATEGDGLDLFCYTGAWSISLAGSGMRMRGVDSSDYAIGQARRNAALSGLTERCEFIKADVFEFMKEEAEAQKRYDCIVLDPPAFVKSKARTAEGLKAYTDTNAACMRLLRPGGLFATSSCSYHVDRAMFLEMLRAAGKKAGRQARIIEIRSQAKDHPVSLAVPETEYLKCVLMEVI